MEDMFDPNEVISSTPEGEEITRARALDDIERYFHEMHEAWGKMADQFTDAKNSESGVSGMAVAMQFEVVHDATHELRNLLHILGQSEMKAMLVRRFSQPATTNNPLLPPIDVEAEVSQIPDAFNPEDWA